MLPFFEALLFILFYSPHKLILRITQRGGWEYLYFVVEILRGQVDFSKVDKLTKGKTGYESSCSDFKV